MARRFPIIDRPVGFSLLLPAELAQDMQDISDYTGLSYAEIFRRALAVYKRAKQCQMSGGKVLIRKERGSYLEIVGF